MDEPVESTRIDKWLWAIRVFKTRRLATEACRGDKVKIGGRPLKPAYAIKPGEVITVSKRSLIQTLKVVRIIERRLGAPAALTCYEDLTPEQVYAEDRERRRQQGSFPGRKPTKQERREIERQRQAWRQIEQADRGE